MSLARLFPSRGRAAASASVPWSGVGQGFTTEVLMDIADIYMMGHSPIGAAIRASGLFAAAHRPFMLQNVGGAITRCMVRGTTPCPGRGDAIVRSRDRSTAPCLLD